MQPTLCSKCKKNVAVVFISRMNEKGEPVNEGLCLKCAAQLGLPQVEDMMKRMGITPDDLENLNSEMMQAFGGAEELGDVAQANEDGDDEDEESGKTATFPFLNRLFGGSNPPAEKGETPQRETGKESRKGEKKHKYLDNYCINLSRRAREGKLDAVIGREEEIQRVVQILNRRQKNNPCLIGEPGVGKTAIAEGLAQRIAAGEVPFKLRDKEVYLLDLTALVAGTQFRGQFESRMKGLIEEIRKLGNVILVIDEVHNIVGAGDAEGSMNAANILKPALSRGGDSGHRSHHLQRIPQVYREGHGAGAALPAGDGGGAQHRGYAEDPQGHCPLLRDVPRGVHPGGRAAAGGAAVGAVYHRPVPAGQGH